MLETFSGVTAPIGLSMLTVARAKDLQATLTSLGYSLGKIDGSVGPKTRLAWVEFYIDTFVGDPILLTTQAVAEMQSKLTRSDWKWKHDLLTMEGTITAIRRTCKALGLVLDAQIAYVLATAQWETAHTLRPVREAFWLKNGEQWRRDNLQYYPYYGRGYVQLTWQYNYAKYSQMLGLNLVATPDLALTPHIALFVLVHGFTLGVFTGHRLPSYISTDKADLVKARQCINGLDHAHDVAELATSYLSEMVA